MTTVGVRRDIAQVPRRCALCYKLIPEGTERIVVSDAAGVRPYHVDCAPKLAKAAPVDGSGRVKIAARAETAVSTETGERANPAVSIDAGERAALGASTEGDERAGPVASAETGERAVHDVSTGTSARAGLPESTARVERAGANESTVLSARPHPTEMPQEAQKEDKMMVLQPTTVKARLFEVMKERALHRTNQQGKPAKKKGWVNLSAEELAKLVSVSEHEVVHALHDMRGAGLVDFNLRRSDARNGRGTPMTGVPVAIRVTQTGLKAQVAPPKAQPAPEPVSGLVTAKVAADDATGVSVATAQAEPESPKGEPSPKGIRVSPPQTGALVLDAEPIDLLMSYPTLLHLADSVGRLSDAEVLLRQAGKTDLAELVAEEAAKVSDMEREAIALVNQLLRLGMAKR